MKNTFQKWWKAFRPPMIPSIVVAIVFSSLSILRVATNWVDAFPTAVLDILYVCAAVSLSLAVWSILRFTTKASPKQKFLEAAGKNAFTARFTQDFAYRTMLTTFGSLVFNLLLTASKMVTGWYYSSTWLMVLAGYYLILCLSKFLLLRYGRKQVKSNNQTAVMTHQWKAYRLCGIMLLVLTAFLQGVVIMIVKNSMSFSYHEIVVISIATYDFYCLINAIIDMIRKGKRKSRSPIVNSLKSIRFASSLVAMLSLQTAMFSAFGAGNGAFFQPLMNILTGTLVCVLLIVLGVRMILRSNKEIKGIEGTTDNEKM